MRLNTRITWPAGAGVNSTVDIISSLYAELWYDLITDIEYESRIKWWVNYFDVNISDQQELFLTKYTDIILAFNADSLEKQIHSLKKWGTIIINNKWLSKTTVDLTDYQILDLEISDKYDNTYLLGIYALFLNLDLTIILEKVAKVFSRKWEDIVNKNTDIIKNIFGTYSIAQKSEFSLSRVADAKKINYWNKALTYWAIEWGLEFYSAYPMTPASTVLTEVIASWKVNFLQAEDEISVANSVLWASFTWKRAMCGTSGWGFALMTEAISFAIQAEFPMTIIFAQRAGPSTGTPTYQEQWDINFALNPTFWDFEHVVLYPSSLEEAHYFGWLALNIADKYQTQVILLMDKQSAELHATHWDFTVPSIDRWIVLATPPEDYKRYELTDSGISPRVNVWTKNWDFIATSYEHDEYGATSEDSDLKVKFTEKRFKKLQNFFEKEEISGYEIITADNLDQNPHLTSPKGRGTEHPKKMIVCYSFTRYTAEHFIKNNPEFGLIVIKVLKPIDERLREEIISNKYEELIFVESNYSGQVEKHLSNELGLKFIPNLKISNLRKYDLFPFYIEDFNELLNK